MIEQITADEAAERPELQRWIGYWRVRVPRKFYSYQGPRIEYLPLYYAKTEEEAKTQLNQYKNRWNRY